MNGRCSQLRRRYKMKKALVQESFFNSFFWTSSASALDNMPKVSLEVLERRLL